MEVGKSYKNLPSEAGWYLLLATVSTHEWCLLVERVRNKFMEKIRDPAGIRTQDLLNTSQMPLPLSHLDPWQRSGRQAT